MTRLRTLYRRITATTRVVPLLAIVATFAALVAFVVQHPTAAMWAVVVALFLALAGLATLVGEIDAISAESDARQAANEILCVELACSDQIIHRLQNDALAAQMAASDADVIPLPVREASPYDWPQNADDAVWQALYDQNGDPR